MWYNRIIKRDEDNPTTSERDMNMKLYKNVNLIELKSIFENGLLSMDESGNDNWHSGKRAKNATDVVYLFEPISARNTFPHYGMVLLEVETDKATESQLDPCDFGNGKYREYTVDRIPSESIIRAYIPDGFRSRIMESGMLDGIPSEKIVFVPIYAEICTGYIDGKHQYREWTEEEQQNFFATAGMNAVEDDFFQGAYPDHHVIYISNVRYSLTAAE